MHTHVYMTLVPITLIRKALSRAIGFLRLYMKSYLVLEYQIPFVCIPIRGAIRWKLGHKKAFVHMLSIATFNLRFPILSHYLINSRLQNQNYCLWKDKIAI